jgi:hypothetical protein
LIEGEPEGCAGFPGTCFGLAAVVLVVGGPVSACLAAIALPFAAIDAVRGERAARNRALGGGALAVAVLVLLLPRYL